ncbi:signal peptidase I [Candidatus Dojkabacteria bacterium]|uniref:Signal peptidase I n=1 Tax=Candidatus Dojkabacteria bacterium TaxID=2099670 RepID=A0A955RGM6_9BACT|nr:signal peptidase I [Candidatus Dojkabacteria bacterium]
MNAKDNPFLEDNTVHKRNYLAWLVTIIAAIITIFAVLYFFVFTPNEVNGPSMLPNYNNNDFLLVSRPYSWLFGSDFGQSLGIEYQRNDVVVFNDKTEGDIVKRVIGLPGETISMKNKNLYIDGVQYVEDYEILNNLKKDGTKLVNNGPSVTLSDTEFFLMGDNRDVSYDSRELGPIDISKIKGKVVLKFWPL